MAHFDKCFIRNFASIMAPITKLLKKSWNVWGLLNVKSLGKISKTDTFNPLYLSILTRNWSFMFTLMHLS
jgi:hypothetical protein